MGIDMTSELAPILWGMIGILVLFGGALVASIDPEVTEGYLGNPHTVLFATLFGAAVVAMLMSWLVGAIDAAAIWPSG